MILGIGYGLRFNCLLIFLKSRRKHTRFVVVLGYVKYVETHFEPFDIASTIGRSEQYLQSLYVKTRWSSMYTRIHSNPINKSFIFCLKMSGYLTTTFIRHL